MTSLQITLLKIHPSRNTSHSNIPITTEANKRYSIRQFYSRILYTIFKGQKNTVSLFQITEKDEKLFNKQNSVKVPKKKKSGNVTCEYKCNNLNKILIKRILQCIYT